MMAVDITKKEIIDAVHRLNLRPKKMPLICDSL